jgi:hypothetical protein
MVTPGGIGAVHGELALLHNVASSEEGSGSDQVAR